MRYLITGIGGMAGIHLANYLVQNELGTVAGIARSDGVHGLPSQVQRYNLDLHDYIRLKECLEDFRPDVIFHLAAQTFIPKAWDNPQATFQNNTLSQMNLLQGIVELGIKPIVHIASSSEVYGKVPESEVPLREDHPLCPANPYGLSKVAQEFMGIQYRESHHLNVAITRTFNHTGPGRGEQYVESSFAKQLVEIEQGMRPPEIYVGNLMAKREFMDVRDVVRAYSDLVLSGVSGGVYHICSGQPISIGELLEELISLTNLSVSVRTDPTRFRSADIPVLSGDNRKIRDVIPWQPKFTLNRTLQDLLDFWREQLSYVREENT